MLLPLLALAAIQSDRLPPANPIPLTADAEVAGVMAPVNALLAAIGSRDAAAATATARPDAVAIAAVERVDGTRTVQRMAWSEFTGAIKPGPERFQERLTDVAVEVDGDIAMVWGPYVFTIAGKVHHCGVDHVSLVRDGGRWQISQVSWSQRTVGCPAS